VLIAEDRDSNPASPYLGFDNSVSLTDSGWVAFTASLDGGARGVFFSDGTTTRSIATTALPEVSEIEFFAPAANEAGVVAFRAKDGSELRAVWVGDGTDLEVARLSRHGHRLLHVSRRRPLQQHPHLRDPGRRPRRPLPVARSITSRGHPPGGRAPARPRGPLAFKTTYVVDLTTD
jgi:hypothetical protein